jgi:hypothetical protein
MDGIESHTQLIDCLQGGIVNSLKNLRALLKLRSRLRCELDGTLDPEDRGALNVAIRSLMNAIDIQETLIRYEQGLPQKITIRDYDTFQQREEHLKAIMGDIKPEE